MSKWQLLKSQLSGKRDSTSSTSIHRFDGYENLVPRKKNLWQGFKLRLEVSSAAEEETNMEMQCMGARAACLSYFGEIDTTEFQLQLVINVLVEETADSLVRELLDLVASAAWGVYFVQHSTAKTIVAASKDYSDYMGKPALTITYEMTVKSPTLHPTFKQVSFWTYTPTSEPSLLLFSREQPTDAGVGAKGLLSNELHGLDNTGNVRVWLAETLLLHILLEQPQMLQTTTGAACQNILELGGGMTGLCGIGLFLSQKVPCNSVTITDGHPDCATNQRVCISMQKTHHGTAFPPGQLQSKQLRWSKGDVHRDLFAVTDGNTLKFDVILAADCLFFTDFHDDLIWTIAEAVSDTGVIYLLQPSRSGSMQSFLQKAKAVFRIEEMAEYNAQITALHMDYVATEELYNTDIHFPILLKLTKLKPSASSGLSSHYTAFHHGARNAHISIAPTTVESVGGSTVSAAAAAAGDDDGGDDDGGGDEDGDDDGGDEDDEDDDDDDDAAADGAASSS